MRGAHVSLSLAGSASVVLLSACSTTSSFAGLPDDSGVADAHDATASAESGMSMQDSSPPCSLGYDATSYGGPSVLCPPAPPALGTACPRLDESCEYGSSWWIGCNLVVRCTACGWEQEVPDCVVADAGGSCPATWAEASALDEGGGAWCRAADCQYPDGYCVCDAIWGGPDVQIGGLWSCGPVAPGCPSPRPNLGTSCEGGARCPYGSDTCGGEWLVCTTDGVWQGGLEPPCPSR
jgi:hypothetical protein